MSGRKLCSDHALLPPQSLLLEIKQCTVSAAASIKWAWLSMMVGSKRATATTMMMLMMTMMTMMKWMQQQRS
jgi:hypothetical protein